MFRRNRQFHLVFILLVVGGCIITFLIMPDFKFFHDKGAETAEVPHEEVRRPTVAVRHRASPRTSPPAPSWTRVVHAQRDIIAQELAGYQFQDGTLEDLVMASGGTPRRSLVVTTWRSGSTFIGDVLHSHPAMYYHYEPLMDFEIRRARDQPLLDKAVSNLRNLMNCDYAPMGDYISYSRGHLWVFLHNSRLWRYCRDGRWPSCWKSDFLTSFCRLFPFQVTKTVRLPLAGAEPLLADQPGLRVLLLVRDPRGTVESRFHRTWCPGNPDCSDPARLCADLEADFHTASRLRETYGSDRLRVVRYEDFSVNVKTAVPALMEFVGLQYHPMVQGFVETHTSLSKGGVSSTFRNSTSTPFKWVRALSWSEVDVIQTKCADAMRLWKYKVLKKADWEAANKDQPPSLTPDMFVDKLVLDNMLL